MYQTSVSASEATVAIAYPYSIIPAKPRRTLGENRSAYYDSDRHKHNDDSQSDLNDVQAPIASAPPEVREIIEGVLQAEKDKLYMKIPRNINDDILKIVKEAIQ